MLRNSKWVVETAGGPCFLDGVPPYFETYTSYITADTDTIINSLSYYGLYINNSENFEYDCQGFPGDLISNTDDNNITLVGYLRQDTLAKIVYILYAGIGHDTVLIDYNRNIGDTVFDQVGTPFILSAIGYFKSGDEYYRTYSFYNNNTPGNNNWFEGFGCSSGVFVAFNDFEIGAPWLLCYSHNDTTIYPSFNPDSTCANGNIISSVQTIIPNSNPRLFPNPANNTVTVTGLKPRTPIIITNLLGQVLVNETAEGNTQTLDISRLAAGMYFVNNMKLLKE